MTVDFNKNGETLRIALDGRLDTVSAPELDGFLRENYDGSVALVIDCKKLEYVSSAGLRVLLWAQKKTKESMKLINVNELVMEVFDMTGFTDVFTIE